MASLRWSHVLLVSLLCSFGGIALADSAPDSVPAAGGRRAVTLTDAGEGAARRITIENAFLRAVINPLQGGRVESLIYKKTNQEMTLPRTMTTPGGLLSDQVWEQDYWHSDWNAAPYEVTVLPQPAGTDRAQVQLSARGTVFAGITIRKTITLAPDRCALQVEYEMTGGLGAEKRARLDFWFHNTIAGAGKAFLPSPAGVLTRPRGTEVETWEFQPTRGWTAFVTDAGAGIAATMESRRLRAVRSQYSPVSTVEWIWRYVDAVKPPAPKPLYAEEVRPAESLPIKSSAQLGFFSGLKEVTGAGDDAVIEMTVEPPKEGRAKVLVKVAALADLDARLWLIFVRLDREQRSLVAMTTNAVEAGVKLKADATGSYDLFVPVGADGSYVIQMSLMRGDKELATFEKELVVGQASGVYAMAPDGPREPESGRRNYVPFHLDFSSLGYETPHFTWAKPYAGGRPKVLALTPPRFEREAVELAQRFDMELTTSLLSLPDELGWKLGDGISTLRKEDLNNHLDKVLMREYDVILLGGDVWKMVPPKAQAKILAKVENGAGLLVIGGAGPAELKDKLPLEAAKLEMGAVTAPVGPHSALFTGIPFQTLPRVDAYSCALRKPAEGQPRPQAMLMNGQSVLVGVVALGKGRIVQSSAYGVVAARVLGPVEQWPGDVWEYEYAILGRLLYFAANKPSPTSLLAVNCTREQVSVRLSSTADGPAKVRLTLRDKLGAILHEARVDAALKAEGMEPVAMDPIVIPVPAGVASACVMADVIVSNDAGTLAWGAGAFPEPKARIDKWRADKTEFRPGEPITLTATFKGTPPAGARMRAELRDFYGRKAAVVEVPATIPETKLTLPVERLLTPIFEARGALVTDAGVLSQSVCEANVKLPRRRDLFMAYFWGYPAQGPSPARDILGKYFRLFHEIGMNGNWGMRDPDYLWAFERVGMFYEVPGSGMSWGGFTKGQIAKDPALSEKGAGTIGDPGIDEKYRKSGEGGAKKWALRHIIGFNCADENRDPPADSCYCPICLAAFRKWLQETQYKTLSDLNKEWGTDFSSWDTVMPMTKENNPKTGDVDEISPHAARTKSYAAWADQRQFNKVSYANHARSYVQGVLSVDPDALVGDSGTQESFPQGGRDYSLLAAAYTMESTYPGTQTPEQYGLGPNLITYVWQGYNKPNPRERNCLWQSLALNNYGFGIFVSGSYIDPDWTLPTDGRDLQVAMREMNRGAGQMLVSAKKTWDPVCLLQSPASLHGAYAIGLRTLHSQSVFGYMKLMDDLAVGYRATSYTQVAQGYLQKSGARVLFLPHMVALSEAECRNIREWVENGGTVVADLQAGIMDEHCRLMPKGQLDDLFGVDRSQASLKEAPADPKKKEKEYWSLRPEGAAAGVTPWPCNTVEVGVKGTTAKALWTAQLPGGETVPVLFHRQAGKGHAYYLACNFFGLYDAKEYSVRARTLREPAQNLLMVGFQQVFEKALADAGVKLHTVVRQRDPATGQAGVRMPWTYIYDKDAGAIHYAVVIREFYIYENSPQDPPVRTTFDRKAHIYDVLAGKYLGYGDAVDLTFCDYTMRCFALLPYRVDKMELKAATSTTAPGTDAVIAAKLATSGGPADAHWFRVDVSRPDGRADEAYSGNVEAKAGQAEVRIPFALSDPAGTWKVRVQDVATGVAAETDVTVGK